MDYSKKTYRELCKEEDRLKERYSEMMDDCLKDGLPYAEFCEKAKTIKESLYFIAKYKRLKDDPVVEYGKEWRGEYYDFETFKKMCEEGDLTDNDGYGNYATLDAKSDIDIIPSDILEGIYREDFTHVIWFGKS